MLDNSSIIVKIKPSKQLFSLLLSVHVLAVFSILIVSINAPATFFFISLTGLSLYYYVRSSQEISGIIVTAGNEWMLKARDGSQINYILSGKTYISDWLSLLVFTNVEQSATKYVILMRDSISIELLSQLKLKLKINRGDD